MKGRNLNAKRRKRFLVHLRPKIKKLRVVRTFAVMDEWLVATIEVEKVFNEIGETLHEPLKDERNEVLIEGDTSTNRHIHVFNETLINFFKGSSGKELVTFEIPSSSSECQLCNMVGHSASMCLKLFNRPKCNKCGRGHKIEDCRVKCYYNFGLGHIEEQCWKKNGRGPAAIANYLEVLVDDEKTTLAKFNQLCRAKNNVFSRTRVPRRRNLVVALEVDRNREEAIEEGGATQGRFGNEMSTAKSKILTHFLKDKISFTPQF